MYIYLTNKIEWCPCFEHRETFFAQCARVVLSCLRKHGKQKKPKSGNFTKVKLLKKPEFRRAFDDNHNRTLVIVFPHDVIMKLHPVPNCNHLNKQQSENFYKNYSKNKGNNIYNYGFEKVDDWKHKGGCVLVPRCENIKCHTFGCSKHLQSNRKIKPTHFRMWHTCGYDKKDKIALLSCEQMIVYQFLKTQPTIEMKVQASEETGDDANDDVTAANAPLVEQEKEENTM